MSQHNAHDQPSPRTPSRAAFAEYSRGVHHQIPVVRTRRLSVRCRADGLCAFVARLALRLRRSDQKRNAGVSRRSLIGSGTGGMGVSTWRLTRADPVSTEMSGPSAAAVIKSGVRATG